MLDRQHNQTFTSSSSQAYDNHVIANSISEDLIRVLQDFDFSQKVVTGGDSRVHMKYLWSKKSSNLEDADLLFDKCQFYIRRDREFVGYIEEEIITFDQPVSYSPLDESAWNELLPLIDPKPCPDRIFKACDVHLAVHNVDSEVEKILQNTGFYYLELHKPDLGRVRIYTMQAQTRQKGGEIFQDLKKSIEKGGGVEGFLKFELTRNLYNQGFSLPPLLLD